MPRTIARRPPAAIPTLEERLRSRFERKPSINRHSAFSQPTAKTEKDVLTVCLDDSDYPLGGEVDEEVYNSGLSIRVEMDFGLLDDVNAAGPHEKPLDDYR